MDRVRDGKSVMSPYRMRIKERKQEVLVRARFLRICPMEQVLKSSIWSSIIFWNASRILMVADGAALHDRFREMHFRNLLFLV